MRILVTAILLFSLSAAAGEVTEFKPRPAAVEEGTDTYIGVLLSEEDFRKLLQDKININARVSECLVDEKVCTQMQETYKLYITKLEDQLKKNNSWFDRNRGTIGMVTGLLLGTGLSVGIVHAVYQK